MPLFLAIPAGEYLLTAALGGIVGFSLWDGSVNRLEDGSKRAGGALLIAAGGAVAGYYLLKKINSK